MIETGHFAELENIVRLTQRDIGRVMQILVKMFILIIHRQTQGPDDDDPVFAAATMLSSVEARADMQTFVYSATLSKDLQRNLKRRKTKSSKKGETKKGSALEDLVERLDFRDPNPGVIDLSPAGGVVAALKESMVECVISDKVSRKLVSTKS